jgi:hypothetical protein
VEVVANEDHIALRLHYLEEVHLWLAKHQELFSPIHGLLGNTFFTQRLKAECSFSASQNHGFQLVIDDTPMGRVSGQMKVVCSVHLESLKRCKTGLLLYIIYTKVCTNFPPPM